MQVHGVLAETQSFVARKMVEVGEWGGVETFRRFDVGYLHMIIEYVYIYIESKYIQISIF